MSKRRKQQKPRLRRDGKLEEVIYLRIDKGINDAIEGYRADRGMITGAEAIRDLLRRMLELEGRL